MINRKKALLFTADWHCTLSQPICRTDDYQAAFWGKIKQVKQIAKKYDATIFNAGDLFEFWKASPKLTNKCISRFPKNMFAILGNHDLPQHNLKLKKDCSWMTLLLSGIFHPYYQKFYKRMGNWGQDPETVRPISVLGKKIILSHIMCYMGKSPWPGSKDYTAEEVIDLYPEADVIVTGHNHRTFVEKKNGRLLINPGSLTRHKADQMNHNPCVFIYWPESHHYKKVYLTIEESEDVMTRDHLDYKKEREASVGRFMRKVKLRKAPALSFEENISATIYQKGISKPVRHTILEWMEELK